MYCLTNICYVCLEKKEKSLIDINSTLSVNMDIIHIISDLPFNLGWMKTKRIILIEACCRRLRETYQLLTMCLKNSAVLQGYMNKINISNTDNEAELRVDLRAVNVPLNNKHKDFNETKCEIKLEEEIYTFESEPIIEETEDAFVNVDDAFIKEEDTWKREAVDDAKELSMENNSTENSDNETDSEIAVNNNTHDADTDSDSSEFASTQGHTTNKIKKRNTPAKISHKCLTCSKSFSRKGHLQTHTRLHTGAKPHKCARCKKCFRQEIHLIGHMRIHTGEKPYECSRCNKYFSIRQYLVTHMRTHTGEKPYKCSTCEKAFTQHSGLVRHIRTHTGERPFECSRCKKCFSRRYHLVCHMRTHTGEKPVE